MDTFSYKFHLNPDKRYTFEAKMNQSKLGSSDMSNIIIYPKDIADYRLYDECVTSDKDLEFEASMGLMIKGKINKDIDNYKVLVKKSSKYGANNEQTYENMKNYTFSGNEFQIGPFPSHNDYQVEIEKEDYEFMIKKDTNSQGDMVFTVSSLEISSLEISVKNGESKHPLPGVSLYITSTDKSIYQKYHLLTMKDGIIKRNLLMGQYFVKAVLKEYAFEPDQQIVN